jgi:hypothetical protein
MSEKKSKVYQYVAPVVADFDNERYATANISLNADSVEGVDLAGEHFDGMKFTVCCPREQVANHGSIESLSDALKDRWNLDLQGVLDVFYSAAFTRPNYKANAKEAIEAQDWEKAHQVAQASIDDDQFNVRKAPAEKVTKAEVQELKGLKALAEAKGMTLEQLIAAAKEL